MRNEKLNNFLMFLGSISLILLPLFCIHEYQNRKNIEKMAIEYYNIEEKIIEMVSNNQEVIIDSGANDKYDYYSYDDFRDEFNKYDYIVRTISKISN